MQSEPEWRRTLAHAPKLAIHSLGSFRLYGEALTEAEALYLGDFLEEERYEDWAVDLREQARAAYVAVARAVAEHALETGGDDGSSGSTVAELTVRCDRF